MVDNQHKKITGYRDLTQDEIDLMNEGKELAELVGKFVGKVEGMGTYGQSQQIDLRWLHIGRTDLQKGFMSVIRSIAKPDSF